MEESPCNCRERVNEGLAPYNTRIEWFYVVDSVYVGMPYGVRTVQIEKGRGKEKARTIFASFCPFCGASMRKAEQPAEDVAAT